MLCFQKLVSPRIKKGTAFVAALISINFVLYNIYTHKEQPPLTSNAMDSFDGRLNAVPSVSVWQTNTENARNLTEELGIPKAKWMDQPIVISFPYVYLLNPMACANKSVELLIAVPVTRSNFEKRQTVRETWGSYVQVPANNATLLFFVGNASETESPDIQTKIDEESKLHADIVQCDFIDSYRNLSLKSLSILRWVDVHCPQTTFLTKADDDMYVNVPKLVKTLREKRTNGRNIFIIGSRIVGAKPVQNKHSKWYTPLEGFSEKVYPAYTSGTSYSMTGVTARILWQACLHTPLFWLEDIYITGLCSRMANINTIDDPTQTYSKPKASGCSFRKFTTGHRYSTLEIRKIHREMSDTNLGCPG